MKSAGCAVLLATIAGKVVLADVPEPMQVAAPVATFGRVRLMPGGELSKRVLRNFDRLEEEKYRPDNVFLTMEASGGWPGDTEGRTMLGLILAAQTTGREPQYLDEILRRIPAKLNERGYFGSVWTDAVNEQQLSGMGWVLRALCAHYRWRPAPATAAAIRRIADNLFVPAADDFAAYPIDPAQRSRNKGGASGNTEDKIGRWELSTDIGCYMIGIDGLVDARLTIDEPGYDGAIAKAIDRFLAIDQAAIQAQAHATLTGIRALLRYGRRYLPEARERFRRYLSDCLTESYANANWFTRYTHTEPCAIVDSYMVALELGRLTGESSYFALADRIYWNALCRAQRRNGGFGLENCPMADAPELKVECPEAHWCCTMRGAEGLFTAARYVAYAEGDVVTLAQYHAAEVELPTAAGVLKFREETAYPLGANVRLTIEAAPEAELTLRFFAPDYLAVAAPTENGFVVRRGRWRPGDVVELAFTLRESELPAVCAANASAGLRRRARGPLLLDREGRTVWHLMAPEIWEKGSGVRAILHRP